MTDKRYDGFISYSHAADGQLAPALQGHCRSWRSRGTDGAPLRSFAMRRGYRSTRIYGVPSSRLSTTPSGSCCSPLLLRRSRNGWAGRSSIGR